MEREALRSMISELIASLGIATERVEVSTGPRVVVSVSSPESKLLIGPQGEHLQALNTIARRLAEPRFGGEAGNFLIDVNGYHECRLEKLRNDALLLAQRARLFKHDIELPSMTSYERLVIHELFASDPEIRTHSEGEGKMRHVVLKYKNASQGEFRSSSEDFEALSSKL